MQAVPVIPENAPFSSAQRAWLNGFLAGWIGSSPQGTSPSTPEGPGKSLRVLFGSQSGNSEGLAKKFAKIATTRGFAASAMGMDQFQKIDWSKESHLLLITSTWGDGEMPDNAKAFWQFLQSSDAASLSHLHYSVLALGDTNYATFCQAGKDFDRRLEEIGAQRIHPRVDCNTDFESAANEWLERILNAPPSEAAASTAPSPAISITTPKPPASHESSVYSRKNPFPAPLLENRLLTSAGSSKEVRHFAFDLKGSNLTYETGDALALFAQNDPCLVEKMIAVLGASPDSPIPALEGGSIPLSEALLRRYEINRLTSSTVKAFAEQFQVQSLLALLAPDCKAKLDLYLWGRDPLDLLEEFPTHRPTTEQWVKSLKKLTPRLYSIASSSKAVPDQIHLTIGVVRYDHSGRARSGLCSGFLADRVPVGSAVPSFVHVSHGFRIPADPSTPIIMVGPGTGIAPFRGFLHERRALAANGKNWLFFGEQHMASDFLYREELEAFLREGILHKLSTAFSRDQSDKIYVQHRMKEEAAELWKWLQEGAHFYICGDARRMAKDVEQMLLEIIASQGHLSAEAATDYLARLKEQKRYQKDVY